MKIFPVLGLKLFRIKFTKYIAYIALIIIVYCFTNKTLDSRH